MFARTQLRADPTGPPRPVDLAPPYETLGLFADRPGPAPPGVRRRVTATPGFEQFHRCLAQIGVGRHQFDQRHMALERFAYQPADQAVGLTEGHTLLDEHLGQVDRRRRRPSAAVCIRSSFHEAVS